MKKSLLALAALTAFAGVASAQSSVTLFGIVDVGLRQADNGVTKRKEMATDGINSSRLGFRGVEDLGGGLRAGFWLEAGLAADTGGVGGGNGLGATAGTSNGAAFFNRRATASLLGGFGEVRLGRDYIPTFWNLTIFDPFGTNGVGAFTNIVAGQGSGTLLNSFIVRANNSLGYFLPSMGGVYGQAMIAAGENTPSPLVAPAATSTSGLGTPAAPGNKYAGGRIGYAGGPINIAASIGQRTVAPIAAFGTADKMKTANIGGSFQVGPAQLLAQYGTFKLGTDTQKVYLLGTVVTFGPSSLKFAYSQKKDNTAVADDAKQLAIGYQYDLSKRTALYGTFSQLKNDAGSALGVDVGGLAAVAGKTYKGIEAGVRHSF